MQQLAADRALDLKSDVKFIGRAESIEEKLSIAAGIPFSPIRVGGLRSLGRRTQAKNLIQMMQSTGIAGKTVSQFAPDVVLASGGYVSAPVVWSAARQKVPVIIELPDLEPGWAIRSLWRASRQVAVSFEEVLRYFPPGRATVTGYPVRNEFFRATQSDALAKFGLDPKIPVVTVFGGSQGAHALNEAVRLNLQEILNTTQLIHISGVNDRPGLERARAEIDATLSSRYHLFEYLSVDMPLALAGADVIVARAGAATLGEFPAVGAASILVPGVFAQRHQEKNAAFLAARGASLVLADQKLTSDLVPTLHSLLQDRPRLEKMRTAARVLARPDAGERISQLLINAALA